MNNHNNVTYTGRDARPSPALPAAPIRPLEPHRTAQGSSDADPRGDGPSSNDPPHASLQPQSVPELHKLRVIAIDPGVTSGIASGIALNNALRFTAYEDTWGKENQHKHMYTTLKQYKPDVIIYERFEYRHHLEKAELFSRELIGVIKLYWQHHHSIITPVSLIAQMPSQAKQGFPNSKLQKLNCYTVGSDHARDATRHILFWWTFGQGFQWRGTDGIEELI